MPENAAKVRTEFLDRCFDTNSKLYLLCTNSTLDKLKERSFFLISIIITTKATTKISQKKLMLTCLADIFRAPLSQSSARRANVNFFFHWSFFYSHDGLRGKAGAASLLYSNSAFDIKKSLHLPQMIGHLFFRNMYLDKPTSRWSLPPQFFDVHTLLIINTRELPWHTYTEIVFALYRVITSRLLQHVTEMRCWMHQWNTS